jgi:hypothetical protein
MMDIKWRVAVLSMRVRVEGEQVEAWSGHLPALATTIAIVTLTNNTTALREDSDIQAHTSTRTARRSCHINSSR